MPSCGQYLASENDFSIGLSSYIGIIPRCLGDISGPHPVLYRLKVIHHSVNQDRFDTVAVVVVGAVIDLAEVMDRHFLVKLIQCLLLNWIVILSGSYTSFRGFRVGSGFEF